MFYSDDIIEEVRSRNDVVSVIGSYVQLKKAGANYSGLCPFHNEKSPSFIVSPARQTFKCFGCGKGGNVLTFIMQYENMTFPEALRLLADRGGITLPQEELSQEKKREYAKRQQMQDVYKFAATYFYRMLRTDKGKYALEYLKNRKLSDETITRFGLGYSDGSLYEALKEQGYRDEFLNHSGLFTFSEREGVKDKFWNRVMYPIMDANSKVIAFGGRVMGDAMPKYLNSPETEIFEKGKHLYGMHVARRTRADYFLLCEGYMDTISLHQAGFDNAVASLGTALTPDQARLLSRYTKVVRITYDNDGAGQKAANRAIPILREAGIRSYVVNMSPYKDPDEFIKALGADEYRTRVEQAMPAFNFELAYLAKDYDLNEAEQKNAFLKEVARRMVLIPDELERNSYIEVFCREYYVNADTFRRKINELGRTVQIEQKNEEIREQDKKDLEQRKKPDTGLLAEQLVLSMLVNDERMFEVIKGTLEPKDFKEGIYRSVAEGCFQHYQTDGRVSPARLINAYVTAEEQSLAATICDTNYPIPADVGERNRAFADAVYKTKARSIEDAIRKDTEENGGKNVIALGKEKKELNGLKALILKKLG